MIIHDESGLYFLRGIADRILFMFFSLVLIRRGKGVTGRYILSLCVVCLASLLSWLCKPQEQRLLPLVYKYTTMHLDGVLGRSTAIRQGVCLC